MSSQLVGLEDFTFPVAIAAQLVSSLQVDIAAQSITTLKVDIAAQSLQALNVNANITNTSIDVVIRDTRITLMVYITNDYIDVNAKITESTVKLDVNIASSSITLDVYITNSSLTVTVEGTANIYIQDFKPTVSITAILEKGTRVFINGSVLGGITTIYTVPYGRRAYILFISYYAENLSSYFTEAFTIWVEVDGDAYVLITGKIKPNESVSNTLVGGIVRLEEGDSIIIHGETDVYIAVSLESLEFILEEIPQ